MSSRIVDNVTRVYHDGDIKENELSTKKMMYEEVHEADVALWNEKFVLELSDRAQADTEKLPQYKPSGNGTNSAPRQPVRVCEEHQEANEGGGTDNFEDGEESLTWSQMTNMETYKDSKDDDEPGSGNGVRNDDDRVWESDVTSKKSALQNSNVLISAELGEGHREHKIEEVMIEPASNPVSRKPAVSSHPLYEKSEDTVDSVVHEIDGQADGILGNTDKESSVSSNDSAKVVASVENSMNATVNAECSVAGGCDICTRTDGKGVGVCSSSSSGSDDFGAATAGGVHITETAATFDECANAISDTINEAITTADYNVEAPVEKRKTVDTSIEDKFEATPGAESNVCKVVLSEAGETSDVIGSIATTRVAENSLDPVQISAASNEGPTKNSSARRSPRIAPRPRPSIPKAGPRNKNESSKSTAITSDKEWPELSVSNVTGRSASKSNNQTSSSTAPISLIPIGEETTDVESSMCPESSDLIQSTSDIHKDNAIIVTDSSEETVQGVCQRHAKSLTESQSTANSTNLTTVQKECRSTDTDDDFSKTTSRTPLFENSISSKSLLQLKTETAAFREAREQDLSKYMSRMEIMSRLDKRMREGTAMALLEARKAFEERKAQGRISTRAVAPAITDSRRQKVNVLRFEDRGRKLSLSEKLDLEAAAFRARARRYKSLNGRKFEPQSAVNTEDMAKFSQPTHEEVAKIPQPTHDLLQKMPQPKQVVDDEVPQPAQEKLDAVSQQQPIQLGHASKALSTTSVHAHAHSLDSKEIKEIVRRRRPRHDRTAKALALVRARKGRYLNEADNIESSSDSNKIVTDMLAQRQMPPQPGVGVSLDGPIRSGSVDTLAAHNKSQSAAAGRRSSFRSMSKSELQTRSKAEHASLRDNIQVASVNNSTPVRSRSEGRSKVASSAIYSDKRSRVTNRQRKTRRNTNGTCAAKSNSLGRQLSTTLPSFGSESSFTSSSTSFDGAPEGAAVEEFAREAAADAANKSNLPAVDAPPTTNVESTDAPSNEASVEISTSTAVANAAVKFEAVDSAVTIGTVAESSTAKLATGQTTSNGTDLEAEICLGLADVPIERKATVANAERMNDEVNIDTSAEATSLDIVEVTTKVSVDISSNKAAATADASFGPAKPEDISIYEECVINKAIQKENADKMNAVKGVVVGMSSEEAGVGAPFEATAIASADETVVETCTILEATKKGLSNEITTGGATVQDTHGSSDSKQAVQSALEAPLGKAAVGSSGGG